MNAATIGKTIAALRKKHGMTQSMLAERLNVSNKAVSKWENGQGYPDIGVFPVLATLFDVSVDFLMLGEKKGIAIAGNILVDMVKNIDSYPEPGMLTYVNDITRAVGGCVPNTAINLAKIDCSMPISAIGCVGVDENGRYLVSQLQKYGIGVDRVIFSDKIDTSFCDVMSLPTGERTFFTRKGANAVFSPSDIDIETLNADIFHIGYILLLDEFDRGDSVYGTVMARFLRQIQNKGMKTSIDVVSDSTADFGAKIIPALKYCNYVIINEIECCSVWNINPRNADGSINAKNIETAMRKSAEAGVADKVIVHAKEISFILDVKSGELASLPSLSIPSEEIKGSVGAGDAFCAGCLYALYNNYSDMQILEFASSAAACNLFAANSTDGMKPKSEILKMSRKYERMKL